MIALTGSSTVARPETDAEGTIPTCAMSSCATIPKPRPDLEQSRGRRADGAARGRGAKLAAEGGRFLTPIKKGTGQKGSPLCASPRSSSSRGIRETRTTMAEQRSPIFLSSSCHAARPARSSAGAETARPSAACAPGAQADEPAEPQGSSSVRSNPGAPHAPRGGRKKGKGPHVLLPQHALAGAEFLHCRFPQRRTFPGRDWRFYCAVQTASHAAPASRRRATQLRNQRETW